MIAQRGKTSLRLSDKIKRNVWPLCWSHKEERAAVEDGIEAMEQLCQQLADVPTSAGPTPKQLVTYEQRGNGVIPIEQIRRKK